VLPKGASLLASAPSYSTLKELSYEVNIAASGVSPTSLGPLSPNYERDTAVRFESLMQVEDRIPASVNNKLPSLNSMLPEISFHSSLHVNPQVQSSPQQAADQDMSKLITSFMAFPQRKL
jgi:hypothetical protein